MNVQIVTRTEGVGKYKNLTTEEIVAAIARHGIIKEDKGKLVKYLMDKHHWSPLDMVNFGIEIETTRAIGRQFLRHASIRPQEHSQRYSDKVVYEPIEIRLEDPVNRQSSTDVIGTLTFDNGTYEYCGGLSHPATAAIGRATEALLVIEQAYEEMVSLGIAKECARGFLPSCTQTTMTMNGSLRSWLAFLNVRMEKHTQKEATIIAELIGEILEKELPNVFAQIDWRNGLFM